MNNISVTAKGGTIASEFSGSQVNLTAPSVVKVHLNRVDVQSFTRSGNDLIITKQSGEKIVIQKFYSADGDSDLVLEDDRGALWWVEDPATEGFQYVSIDSTEGLLAENVTNTGTIAAFGIGGAALAGLGAAFAGGGGGGGGGGDNGGTIPGDGGTTPGDGGTTPGDGGTTPGDGGTTPGDGGTTPGDGGTTPGGGSATPPSAVTNLAISDSVGPIRGAIVNGTATDDNQPVLSGNATPGTLVNVYDGGTLLGSAVTGANGTWQFTAPTLADGAHSFTTVVTDSAGNASAPSAPVNFTVDTQAPTAATDLALSGDNGGGASSIPANATTTDNTPVLSGRGEPGSVVQIYDGTAPIGSTTVDGNGNWAFTTPALSNGAHSLYVTLTDAAGNVSAPSASWDFTVQANLPDATSPLEITDDSGPALLPLGNGSSTSDNTPTLSGLASPGALIALYNGSTLLGTAVAGSNGQWIFIPDALADGTYALSATVTDTSGNVTQTPVVVITVDIVPPTAASGVILSDNDSGTVEPIAAGGATNSTTPVLSGSAEPGSTVTIRDGDTVLGTALVGSNGRWSFTTPSLSEGSHSLTTTVTDAAGNVSPASDALSFSVDTLPPAAADALVVSDDVGAATGPLASGDTTDDSTPTLSGTAEANGIVRIYDGSTLLGSTAADAQGNWSFTPPALSNGAHALSVTVTDAAGNISAPTSPFDLTVAAGVPPTTSSLQVTDDSGSTLNVLPAGGSTQDTTPVLSGVAAAGVLVTLYNGTTVLGSAIADASGQWSFIPAAPLADGTYAFRAVADDGTGNFTDSITLNITIDSVPPAAADNLQLSSSNGSIVTPVDNGGTTGSNVVTLGGSAEPGGTVVVSDGNNVLGSAVVDSNGNWRFTTPALSEGAHSLTTTVTDAAGNTGAATTPLTFTVDNTPPAAISDLVVTDDVGTEQGPLTSGDVTDDNTPTLSGSGEPGALLAIYDGSTLLGNTTVGLDGSWTFTTPALSNGNHTFTLTATDAAGNLGPASAPFVVNIQADLPAPTRALQLMDDSGNTVQELFDGGSTNVTSLALTGLVGAGNTVTLYDGATLLGSTVAGSNGRWAFRLNALFQGVHSIRGTVTDAQGNTTDTLLMTFTVDSVAPDAATNLVLTDDTGSTAVSIAAGSLTKDATPVLSGTAEAGSLITVRDGEVLLGSVVVNSAGNWSFASPALADGSHSLTATVSDAAGNVSPPTAPLAFTVDSTAPAAASNLVVSDDVGSSTGPLTSGTTTDDSTPTLSGTAEAGSVVRIYDGSVLLGSVTVASDGSWRFTPDAPMTNGQHDLTTTVTDAAGNVSPASPAFTLNIEAGVPVTNELIVISDDSGSTYVQLLNNSSTSDNTPIVSGQSGAGFLITIYNGTVELGTATADANGQWAFTPAALSDGTYVFRATATDPASGAASDTPTLTVTIDTVAPAAPVGVSVADGNNAPLPDGSSTNTNTLTLSGSGEPGGTVTVADENGVIGTVTVDNSGNWTFTTPALSDGNHSLVATVTDAAGNTGSASAPVSITVDTLIPAVAENIQLSNSGGTPIAAGGVTNDTAPVLSGLAEPGGTVTVSDGGVVLGTAVVNGDGSWQFTPNPALAEGNHSLTSTVTDAAGNLGPASAPLLLTVDTTPPTAASAIQVSNDSSGTAEPLTDGGTTNDVTPLLSGRAEPGSTVNLFDGTTLLGTATVGNDGNWTFSSPVLADGPHSLTTTVTDAAGNTGPASDAFVFTVDTSAPAAPGGIQLSNDSGTTPVTIAPNSTTNDATPVLSGTAEPGSSVIVYDGDAVLGSVIVGSGGSWSFTTPALAEGAHSLSATVTSAAGNTGAPSAPIAITVDTTPPAAAGALQLSNDSSGTLVPIAAGSTTNDTTPVLSGTAEAGATVTVRDNGAVLGTALVDAAGNWQFTAAPLAAGAHSFTATVTDAAGNSGPTSAAIPFNLDTTEPVPASNLLLINDQNGNAVPITNGFTNDTTPVLSGTAAAGSTVTVLDGTTVLGTVLVGSGGNWSFTAPTLTQGAHSLTTTVTSAAGNVSEASAPLAFTVDTQAPTAAQDLALNNDAGETIPAGSATRDATPTLSGTAEAGSTVILLDNGSTVLGSAVADQDGNWQITPQAPLSEGAHSLTVSVTDPAGNVSAASAAVSVIVDNTAPEEAANLQLSSDSSGSQQPVAANGAINDTAPILTGTAEAGGIVTVSNGATVLGTTVVDPDGNWRFTPDAPLGDGDYSLTVTVTDAAGNVGPASTPLTFTVDTTPPPAAADLVLNNDSGTAPQPIAANGFTNDTTPVLSGTAEEGSIVTVRDGTTVLGSTVAGSGGAWSFTSPALSQGTHSFTATVSDAAGNSSDPSAAFAFTVDTQAPDVASSLQLSNDNSGSDVPIAQGGRTNDTTPVLSGTAEANSLIVVRDNNQVLGSVVAGTDGNWRFTPADPLAEGAHSFTATVSDAAGNVSAPSAALDFTVDTTVPDQPADLTLSSDLGITPVTIGTGDVTRDATPVLTGTAEAGSTIAIRDAGAVLGTAIADSNGNWRFTPDAPLGEGAHSLTATVTDLAGNSGPASAALAFTVDTVAPDAAREVIAQDSAGNTLTGLTNDSTPTLSGLAEAGGLVVVYDGATALGSVQADATTGAWSFTSPVLTDGGHSLSVQVIDAAGNVSTSSEALALTVDTRIPETGGISVTLPGGAGEVPIADNGYTNVDTPILSGTTVANGLVTLYDGTTAIASVTADAQGAWRLTSPALGEGGHALAITVTDVAGNVSTPSTPFTLNIDTVTPDAASNITLSNDAGSALVPIASGGVTNDTTPQLNGSAEVDSVVRIYDGSTLLGSVTADSSGSWSFTPETLSQGAHTFSTTVTDAAGNVSANSSAIAFTVDSVAPGVATDITLVNNNGATPQPITNTDVTNDSTPELSGQAEANSTVIISDGSTVIGSTTADALGAWRFTPTLTDGTHALTVVVRDAAGNSSIPSASLTVTVDTAAPPAASDLVLTNDIGGGAVTIPNGGLTNDSTPVLSGTAIANALVQVYDGTTLIGSATADADGNWRVTTSALSDAVHTLNVTVTNSVGNVSAAASVSLTVDTSTPDAPASFGVYNNTGTVLVDVINGGYANDSTPVLLGTGVAGTTINVFDGDTLLGTARVDGSGAWRFDAPALLDGPHSLSVSVTNAAGTTGALSPFFDFTLDTAAPEAVSQLTVTDNVGGSTGDLISGTTTDDSTPAFSGQAEIGSVVRVYDGTTLIGSTTAGSNGSWTFTPGALANGAHSFTFTATDAAGNVSAVSAPAFDLNVQADLPPATTTLQLFDQSGSALVTLADGAYTQDSTPVLSGLTTAGYTVQILDGSDVLGTVTADANGQWTFTPDALSEGPHALSVIVSDGAGNDVQSPVTNIIVDTVVPTAVTDLSAANTSGTTPVEIVADSVTNVTSPELAGTTEANALVTVYDGNAVIGSTVADAAGAWRFSVLRLAQGAHALSVSVTDAAGNVGPRSAALAFTVDSVAPDAASPLVTNGNSNTPVANGGLLNDSTPLLSGTTEANAIVTLYDGTTAIGSTTASAAGAWSFTPTQALSEGNHALTVRITDVAGNISAPSAALNVVVDTLAPAAVDLTLSNNQGSAPLPIAAESITNDSTPQLSGTAEAGSVVSVYDGTTLLGTVTAGSNGAWSFTTGTLADGPHTLNVTATDAAGNVSPNAAITFTVDTTAPAAVVDLRVTDNVGSIVGDLANGAVTDDATPTLSGTAEANAVVSIFDGSTLLGSITAGGDGAWSFTPVTLSNGPHALSVTVRDAAGNVSAASDTVTITVDTVAPTGTTLAIANDLTGLTIPDGGITNDATPVLSGSAEAGSVVTIFDGTTLLGTVTVDELGAWSFTTGTLSQGAHVLSATVTDAAGNVSGTTSATIAVDTVAPAAVADLVLLNNNGSSPITIAANGLTNDSTPRLNGTAEAGSVVSIYDGTTLLATVTAGSNGAWSYISSTLADGLHTLNVTATDAAGNVSPNAAVTFTVDTTAPATVSDLRVTDNVGSIVGDLVSGAITDDATPTLSGTAEANAVVSVYDGSTLLGTVTAGGDGTWSFTTAALSNGAHALNVTVRDAAGNVSAPSATVAITVDTVAPAAATLAVTNDITGALVPNGGLSNDTTPVLSGTAEANSRVSIYDGTTLLGTAIVGSSGSWSFVSPALSQGAHALNVTVTDAAGNVSGTTSASVIVDSVAPAAVTGLLAFNNSSSTAVGIPGGGVTNDSTPLLTGSGEVGARVSVYDGATLVGTATVGSNGSWSVITSGLSNGLHTLNVTQTDAAGNVSATASTVLTVDTVAPAVSTLIVTDDSGANPLALVNGAFTRDTTPVLSGTAEANAIVTVYDGSTVLGSVTAGSSGAWSFTTAALSNGAHALNVTVRDAAGNVSAPSATVAITVDTVAPATTTLAVTNDITGALVPNGGLSNDTTPVLSGTAEANSRVSIYDGSTLLGTAIAGSSGSWSFTTPVLGQGAHALSVTVTDAAGNVSGATAASLIVDSVAPAAVTGLLAFNNNGSTALGIPGGGLTNDSTPLLTGSGEVGARVSVYDGATLLGTTTVGSNGSWSFTTPALSNGLHTLNVTQTDAAGNVSATASTALRIDTVAPLASSLTIVDDSGANPVTLVSGAFTRDTTPVLSGTAEANALVTVYDGSTVLGSVTAGSSGAWSFTPAALANGAHVLSTTVTDSAGNVSTGNATATVTVDTVAPAAVGGLAINTAGTLVSGSGEVGAVVTVRDSSGASLGTATVGSGGTWSVSLSTPQITGASLSVVQTDRAGNTSASASLLGAIRVVATNDVNEVDYVTTSGLLNNGSTNYNSTALLSANLSNTVSASVLSSTNAYLFNVGAGDSRSVTLHGTVTSLVSLTANYTLYLYKQNADGSWSLQTSNANYIQSFLSLGTQSGANITYSNLNTGRYAVLLGTSNGVAALPATTISTTSDITTLAVTVAASVTGNLLANDTSSLAGTVPTGTAVSSVTGNVIAATGNTVITSNYGTLTLDAKGNYTYTLKAGLDVDTLPASDVFTYSVRDASGAVTSANLTITLHNGLTVNTFMAQSLRVESEALAVHDASGSIYGDSTASHSGTLSITNEQGEVTQVNSIGTTQVAGVYGVLSIAADGSYTYALNAGVDGQTLTHQEVFSYTLTAADGTLSSQQFTIDLHPIIEGTSVADTLTSGAYDDVITAGAGADTLVYHLLANADATGGNGHDSWTDFSVAQGDKIDISDLLIGWNDSTSNVNDFVKVDHTPEGNTVLSIDRDGTGTGFSSTQLITLEGVNVSLEELLQQPHQIHTA
ncbi:Ig-like domain-containing protein [Pantoea sp. Mb-10]|uniref:Ig-like domain-containing protein n=1 Tax=unclassified Pantoea TaxID=2630326 RepID=UPI001E58AE88|nr:MULTISPECIES: Ig-like domain-containing protein [unclassified Pantoea]MCE0489776.1 Ig-like domain-containing protein [Pantoea sp. Mb-10]MCE0501119.1 Ig-like domain-containing protein [Pantoea sp. Pb-8]